ncbi:MAG TPA: MBL fold metallo-hydrolase [Xanthomonadales bacterium]|nr:MBL fold metallo-hydrolase [Xanthomonadales bacterium]
MLRNPGNSSCIKKAIPHLSAVLWFALVAFAGTAHADPFELAFTELSPGVWAGVREDSTRIPVVGNSLFVVGDKGVIVYDSSVASTSEQVMAKMREVTDLPITHMVVSHWHGDHNLGVSRIIQEFPSVQVISHEFTRAAMAGSNLDYARNLERVEGYLPSMQEAVETGIENGEPVNETTREWYRVFLEVSDIVDTEYRRSPPVVPTVTFKDRMVIHSGERQIELLYLGDANTAGDIVLWLPAEKVVATGDMVVVPTPYGFNVPPRKWVQTLKNLNALGYKSLLPGHGAIQRDTAYVDLIIETAESIADQRDALLAKGLTNEEAQEKLDYSKFRNRYTGGEPLLEGLFDAWFTIPFSAAAFKALTGEPMVVVGPSEYDTGAE